MMMLKIKLDTEMENSLDKYCLELNDLLINIEHDKNILVQSIQEHTSTLREREAMRSCIYEKLIQFHDLFFNKCITIIDDIYLSRQFEYASAQNLMYITEQTKNTLLRFYKIYQYNINPVHFDIVIKHKYNDKDYQFIFNDGLNYDYIKLDKYKNVNIDNKVMISYLYQLITNYKNW